MNFDPQIFRHKMIEQQIRPWSVSDTQVLESLEIIKREMFVDENQHFLAFSDILLPIHGTSQRMLEPKIEARVLQAIKPHGKENVLEIGTGSGYMSALLAYFAKHVTTVEILPELAEFAITNLNHCRIPNVKVEIGDGSCAWKAAEKQMYDIICVSGGLPEVPDTLKHQLNINGRLLAFIGQEPLMQAVLITRLSHDYFQSKTLFETLVPMLQTEMTNSSFVF